jgi:hypothetical protein
VLAMLERSACSGERQSLGRLPAPLRDRLDDMYNSTASLVLELRANLGTLEAKGVRDAAAAEAIVGKVVQRLLSGPQRERDVSMEGFIATGGHMDLVRVLQLPAPAPEPDCTEGDGAAGSTLPDAAADTLNQCLHALTELCATHPRHMARLTQVDGVLQQLFGLMRFSDLIDSALGLLLSAGNDVVSLTTVDGLPGIVQSLSPRGLALFCRALAGIFSKNDEPGDADMPPPECIPPNLCTVCLNREVLLKIELLLPRVVRLLAVGPPPHWLCPMPNQPNHMANLGDSWATLGAEQPAEPPLTILLTEEQIPQGLPATRYPNSQLFMVQLSAFKQAAWNTLQADLLFVVWELMGGKTRQKTQDTLVRHGFVKVLHEIFDRLSWAPPEGETPDLDGEPGCVCGPQSCMQIAMLRALQAFCEKGTAPFCDEQKDGAGFEHHRLLLSGQEQVQLYGAVAVVRGVDSADPELDELYGLQPGEESLLWKVAAGLMGQSPDAAASYRFWMASCVHKWAQASSWAEQQYLGLNVPGFMMFVLQAVLYTQSECENTHKVCFDILAELIKFNPPMLRVFHDCLVACQSVEKFTALLDGNVVNASVFIQCVALTISGMPRPPRAAQPGAGDGEVWPAPVVVGDPYEATPVKALKVMLDQRGVDRSGCIEKVDLVLRLRSADAATRVEPVDSPRGWIIPDAELEPEQQPQPEPDKTGAQGSDFVDCGAVAIFVWCRQPALTMKLIDALDAAAADVDNLCVVNAALLLCMTAERHGEMAGFIRKVLRVPTESEVGRGVEGKIEAARHFGEQLLFWEEYYGGQASDRQYMEFSSGIDFAEWTRAVQELKVEFAEDRLRQTIRELY